MFSFFKYFVFYLLAVLQHFSFDICSQFDSWQSSQIKKIFGKVKEKNVFIKFYWKTIENMKMWKCNWLIISIFVCANSQKGYFCEILYKTLCVKFTWKIGFVSLMKMASGDYKLDSIEIETVTSNKTMDISSHITKTTSEDDGKLHNNNFYCSISVLWIN